MATFRAEPVGADRVARRLSRAAAQIDLELQRSLDDLGQDAELIYMAHAPRRTGRLARGIVAHRQGGEVIVRADARNPESGYDYVGVTRFGHRKAWITPRHDRAPASSLTGRARRTSGGFLRFTIGGRVIFARRVRGYHPSSDWAERALPQIEGAARQVATRLGRRIEAVVG